MVIFLWRENGAKIQMETMSWRLSELMGIATGGKNGGNENVEADVGSNRAG